MHPVLRVALIAAYNIGAPCLIFGLSEYTARKLEHRKNQSQGPVRELILDRWAAFRNNPNYVSDSVRINHQGFRRDTDVTVEKPPSCVRIFLLGGSVAYGGDTLYPEINDQWKINNSQTIDQYLEKRLNSEYPGKRWEVVNAASKGYTIVQNLAFFLSVVQRYQPDYVISIDGVNDVFSLLRNSGSYDAYHKAGFYEEFNNLTNPESFRSLRMMLSIWLANNSALFRTIQGHMRDTIRRHDRRERVPPAGRSGFPTPTALERQRSQTALNELEFYKRTIRQFHRVIALDGIEDLYVLQPELATTRKPLVDIEAKLLDYHLKLDGSLYVYGFRQLSSEISRQLFADMTTEGYRFLDLSNVFDRMNGQTFTDYCHLTPDGNQAVADAIFDFLSASFERRAVRPVSSPARNH